jgi:hypothetical protein
MENLPAPTSGFRRNPAPSRWPSNTVAMAMPGDGTILIHAEWTVNLKRVARTWRKEGMKVLQCWRLASRKRYIMGISYVTSSTTITSLRKFTTPRHSKPICLPRGTSVAPSTRRNTTSAITIRRSLRWRRTFGRSTRETISSRDRTDEPEAGLALNCASRSHGAQGFAADVPIQPCEASQASNGSVQLDTGALTGRMPKPWPPRS